MELGLLAFISLHGLPKAYCLGDEFTFFFTSLLVSPYCLLYFSIDPPIDSSLYTYIRSTDLSIVVALT